MQNQNNSISLQHSTVWAQKLSSGESTISSSKPSLEAKPQLLQPSAFRRVMALWVVFLALGMQGCFSPQQDVLVLANASNTVALVAARTTEQDAQLQKTKAILDQRLQKFGVSGASVQVKGAQLHITLPKMSAKQRKQIKDSLLMRRGLVRILPLAKDQSFLQRVKDVLGKEKSQSFSSFHVIQQGKVQAGAQPLQVWVVDGAQRAQLQEKLAKLAREHKSLQLPKHQEIAFRQRKGKHWGVYVLDKQKGMIVKQFASVDVMQGAKQGDSSGYKLRMHGKDTVHFQRMTRNHLGEPVWLMVDEQVIAAPVVKAEISSGQMQFQWSQDIPTQRTLGVILQSGALPLALTSAP
ncbi:MAG: hypothetical protein H6728_10585 [Myxococcales bacterium]|nr:hypothetical protein [Myxococcales bacterium]